MWFARLFVSMWLTYCADTASKCNGNDLEERKKEMTISSEVYLFSIIFVFMMCNDDMATAPWNRISTAINTYLFMKQYGGCSVVVDKNV